jgi:NADPH-dependent 2,4-dienoyl-CoA reductase/sulfur reductase-like enzyme
MKREFADIAIIGGGPAGLAAALETKRLGVEKVMLIERDIEPGGILRQCIHDGFGIHRFKRRMSGNEYAQAFIDEAEKNGIDARFDTMALEITRDKRIYACNNRDGMLEISAGAIILATGCRERTASQVFIYGDRPAGVLTAGVVQRYVNMEGYLPGKTAVILGSGDIGLIMARRMTLEGMKVKGVYEVMPSPGGLTRNIAQCLNDYDIPLYLSTTVVAVNGRDRVSSVTVAKVDERRMPIKGTEETVECDLLVLAVGLIPENELAIKAGVEMDGITKGAVLDDRFETSIPGIFAAGNAAAVFDLVDYVSVSGEIAARGAVEYLKEKGFEKSTKPSYMPVIAGENVSFVIPRRIREESFGNATFFMRVKTTAKSVKLRLSDGDGVISERICRHIAPPEMLSFETTQRIKDKLTVDVIVTEGAV